MHLRPQFGIELNRIELSRSPDCLCVFTRRCSAHRPSVHGALLWDHALSLHWLHDRYADSSRLRGEIMAHSSPHIISTNIYVYWLFESPPCLGPPRPASRVPIHVHAAAQLLKPQGSGDIRDKYLAIEWMKTSLNSVDCCIAVSL